MDLSRTAAVAVPTTRNHRPAVEPTVVRYVFFDTAVHLRRVLVLAFALAGFTIGAAACAANPFVEWRDRLFGAKADDTPLSATAPHEAIELDFDRPERFRIDEASFERDFPEGKSRYRVVELPRQVAHATLRIRVRAVPNDRGRGNTVFKPVLYLLDDRDKVLETKDVDPLYIDIRPFKPTRLLACVNLEKVRRLAIATTPKAVGTSFDATARGKLSAPSKGKFYYSTDPMKVKLPYAATGELVVELSEQPAADQGC